MIDHDALMDAFRDYARLQLQPSDVGRMLYRLTDQVVEVVGVDGAGVSVVVDGHLSFVTATDAHVIVIEETQVSQHEGPCHEAFETGELVPVVDLRTESRWPAYREAALAHAARAVVGVPMTVGQQRVGALNLYRRETPHAWTAQELEAARLLADMATGYIISTRQLAESRDLNDQLQTALDSRVVIEQAKGILAERSGIQVGEAFDVLRAHARRHRRPLHDVCRAVIDGSLQI